MTSLDSRGHRHVAKRQDGSVHMALSLLESMARHTCALHSGVIEMEDLLSAGHLTITEALRCHDPRLAPLRAYLGLRIRWALAGESRMLRKKFRDKPVPPAGREPPDPESEMMARQRQRELRAALARLPDAEQQLVVDHYFHDKPIRQVASERRISRSTAWRRHRTAMGRLRRQLAEVACP